MARQSHPADHRIMRVVQFLDAYQKQEILWNPALESYKNKQLRDEAYKNIIREMKMPALTVNDIKLKVKSVRTTYTKELRLLTKHKESGQSYQPKLFWFNRAHDFLKHVSLSREKRQNLGGGKKCSKTDEFKPCVIEFINHNADVDEAPLKHSSNDDHDMGDTVDLDDHCNTSSSYDYKSIQPTVLETRLHEADIPLRKSSTETEAHSMSHQHADDFAATPPKHTPQHSNVIGTTTTTTIEPLSVTTTTACTSSTSSHGNGCLHGSDDEYNLFCRSVCAQLRGIADNYSRSMAKLKIQQILFEAETGRYRNN